MNKPPSPIASKLEALGIAHSVAAPYIGITVNWMWDLAEDPDEAWNTLTLIQLCRTSMLFGLDVAPLRPTPGLSGLPDIECEHDQSGILQVSGALRTKFTSKVAAKAKLKWEPAEVKRWLSDDEELADIPIPALEEICQAVGVDTCSTIRQYLTKLGIPVSR